MVRYRCAECGEEQDWVERYREDHGEERTCCPRCGAPAEQPALCCAACGRTVEGELDVCAACAEEFCRENWEETVAWLKARTGGLGWFSWTDFVLGEVFGISECRDESLLLAALAPAVRDEALAGRQIADQLWAYISADRDSLRTYCEWIGGIL